LERGTISSKGCQDGLQMADEEWQEDQILGELLVWELFIGHSTLGFILIINEHGKTIHEVTIHEVWDGETLIFTFKDSGLGDDESVA
jgi:hypothetical protein